ncbi:hypothetical protein STCU_07156 [Strigomonas culicis]|uniref:Uncharacterized protein n=1 Tax=Strigomonas culicis TaxID=28005 RepID=S9VBU4_9TRYP|nr:hypothetical protein STCU_07156 [Strigomonas culicis]|eukprot:EPY24486.1 hypothetical protein STCU_07156 [Strigomonas culicis]
MNATNALRLGSSPAGGRLDTTLGANTTMNMDATSSQAPNIRRFGSTVQARRATRGTHAAPRIPLQSSYARFVQTLLQEKAAQQWADELVRRESELNVNVKQLRADLLREEHLRESEVAERQAQLVQLQVELRTLQQRLADREADVRQHAAATAEGHQRRAQEQDDVIQRAQQAEEAALTAEARAHELFARHLQQRTADSEALAADWAQKNAHDIRRAEQLKLGSEQERQTCADRLAEVLQEREAQITRQTERDAQQKEKEEAAAAAAARRDQMYAAASLLEAAVKAMLTRHAIQKASKSASPRQREKAASRCT